MKIRMLNRNLSAGSARKLLPLMLVGLLLPAAISILAACFVQITATNCSGDGQSGNCSNGCVYVFVDPVQWCDLRDDPVGYQAFQNCSFTNITVTITRQEGYPVSCTNGEENCIDGCRCSVENCPQFQTGTATCLNADPSGDCSITGGTP